MRHLARQRQHLLLSEQEATNVLPKTLRTRYSEVARRLQFRQFAASDTLVEAASAFRARSKPTTMYHEKKSA